MERQCVCKKILSSPKSFLLWGLYTLGLVIFVSLVVGSYLETEPTAARMFCIPAVVYALIAGIVVRRLTQNAPSK